ncbi:cytochrome c oxidase subunit 5b [Exophiala aquamarina CBS 119918]|uniref:Cytochrome c oxidase subunit 4, mitochondrial n=1 Tax=Exophiala aquamarina CBS 119918 TaxID=1182545 RepID=A0A072P9R7_9EURO|nr:cytochrome c oxidase subunit 5b [Exophiala aquamarina CBS 119918]KEF56512.1 cytochrome c oxidase subunit 5b [Exophiala aquamarina CBS 119918]
MSVARVAFSLARRVPFKSARIAPRAFSTVQARREKWDPKPGESKGQLLPFEEIKSDKDLLPPGAEPGTVPTDLEQATGLERLEILGKMQGIDIFDMSPLPSDRTGTFENPIVIKSAGEEIQAGCTGSPADSHVVRWCVLSRDRPFERCDECGSVYRMDYVGPADDPHDHGHGHHGYEEPKTMADFVKPEYWYR